MAHGETPAPVLPTAPAPSSGGSTGEISLLTAWLSPPRRPGLLARLDRYDLIRLVGVGGMGFVFLARACPNVLAKTNEGTISRLERLPATPSTEPGPEPGASDTSASLVAIKVLKPELQANARAAALFRKETGHLQKLEHPHILKLIAASPTSERAYFVMPWFERGSLADRIRAGKPISPDEVLRWGKQMASALDYAHRKGIIHRDLKPANVLLDPEDTAVVADFGLARTVFNDSVLDIARPGGEGTSAYLSPALAAGEAEDTRCDIYAFGAILYELLTGKPPYQGSSREEIVRQILAGPPVPITSLNPAAPRALVEVAEGAMARQHRDRYANIADVMVDLDRVANGQKPLGPQPTGTHRRRPGSRSPAPLTLLTLGIALLTLFIVWRMQPPPAPAPEVATTPLRLLRTLSQPSTGLARQTLVGDYDGDRQPNLFNFQGNQLDVLDQEGELVRHLVLQAPDAEALSLDWLQDIDSDGRDELFFSWRRGPSRIVSIRNQNLLELKRFQISGEPSSSAPGAPEYHNDRIIPQRVVDLEGDGRREFLAAVTTGFKLTPRGVWCFDYESGQFRWSYETATMVMRLEVADLNEDGRQEVLFTGNAVGNHKKLPDGTTDNEAWLYVLKADGKLKWKHLLEVGEGAYCSLLLTRTSPKRAPDIYVSVTRTWEFGQREMGRLLRLDTEGHEIGRAEVGSFFRDAVILEGEKGRELILADRNGVLHAFDADLRPTRTHQLLIRRFNDVEIRLKPMPDREREALPNLICLSLDSQLLSGNNGGSDSAPPNIAVKHEPTLWVLGPNFQVLDRRLIADLWKFNLSFQAFPLPGAPGKHPRIAVLDDSLRLFEFVRPATTESLRK